MSETDYPVNQEQTDDGSVDFPLATIVAVVTASVALYPSRFDQGMPTVDKAKRNIATIGQVHGVLAGVCLAAIFSLTGVDDLEIVAIRVAIACLSIGLACNIFRYVHVEFLTESVHNRLDLDRWKAVTFFMLWVHSFFPLQE